MTSIVTAPVGTNGQHPYAHIRVEVEEITPQRAAQLLESNHVNRRPREKRIDLYAKQMSQLRWRITGESIVVGIDGSLLQGQHRLMACVKAGVSFWTVVVYGVDPDAMKVMDTGLSRTASDAFSMEKITSTAAQAATVKWLIAIEGGFYRDTSRTSLITRDELLDYYHSHADQLNAAHELAGPPYSALRHSRAGWNILAFLLLDADSELTQEFLGTLGTGADMTTGDARLALRAYAINATAARRKLTPIEVAANGIKAWNSWINNASISHIKGWKPVQPFPVAER